MVKRLLLIVAILVSLGWGSVAVAFGDADQVNAKLLRLPGGEVAGSRRKGVEWMLYNVAKRTSIETGKVNEISLESDDLFASPFLYLTGDAAIPQLSNSQRERLVAYLTAGGFLYIDVADGFLNGPFFNSIKALLSQLFPDRPLVALSRDHVIYSSFYLLDQPYGRTIVDPTLYGVFDGNRLMVLVNPNDLAGALARNQGGGWLFSTIPDSPKQREYALRFAINLFMYATCLNYKKDQAHIPFIMKRRNWK